jgi:hypothetical protein
MNFAATHELCAHGQAPLPHITPVQILRLDSCCGGSSGRGSNTEDALFMPDLYAIRATT